MKFTPSPTCFDLIKHFEGLCLEARSCPAGIPTDGYGHTQGVQLGDVIDKPKAEAYLASDVAAVAAQLGVIMPPHVVLDQGQQDALISLCFNLAGGPHALPRKAPRLWADLIAGKLPDAAHEFLDMDHALVSGKPTELPGLKARREAEAALFLHA